MKDYKMDKNISKEEKAIQKALSRMLANKFVQHYFYKGCIKAITQNEERRAVESLFNNIAGKLLNEHYNSFLCYAKSNCMETPIKFSEIEKHADSKVYRCLETLKRDQNATYYVEKAIELQDASMKAIDDIIDSDKDGHMPYEFMSIVYRTHCDDADCKQMLGALADAYKAGADYAIY